MLIIAIACAAFCATFAGGLFALRLKDKLHLTLGFSAGAVIAVAFFDLLPEAIALAEPQYSSRSILVWAALGFLFYLVLDRIRVLRGQPEHEEHEHHRAPPANRLRRAWLGAGSLSAHSVLDGVAIGLAFQAAASIGVVVAIAVLTHDFSDGINTTNIVLKHGGDRGLALRWLTADALAPVFGVSLTFFFTLPQQVLGILLALFAGFFLYIGASDLIPESYHAHPKFLTTVVTVLGAAVLYLAVTFAGR